RVEAVITPPQYASQRRTTVDLAARPAVMTVGSEVELRVTFNKPLDPDVAVRLESAGEGEPPAVQWGTESRSLAVGRATAADSVQFHIKAGDTDGFENS